jgi:hypothetical protein
MLFLNNTLFHMLCQRFNVMAVNCRTFRFRWVSRCFNPIRIFFWWWIANVAIAILDTSLKQMRSRLTGVSACFSFCRQTGNTLLCNLSSLMVYWYCRRMSRHSSRISVSLRNFDICVRITFKTRSLIVLSWLRGMDWSSTNRAFWF